MNGMRLLRAALIFSLATACFADIITLRNGRVINGIYLGGTARQMQIQVGDNIETVDVTDVARIEFRGSESSARDTNRPTLRRSPNILMPGDDPGPSLSRPPVYPNDDGGPPVLRRANDSANPPANSAAAPTQAAAAQPTAAQPTAIPAPIEIPANTNFFVRTIEAIDSETAKEGQTFVASLDRNILVNGSVVIPSGSDVVLKLVDEKQSGRVTGKTSLTIALWQVKVGGKLIDVNTQNIQRDSASRTGKTAKAAGTGAVIGGIIGAVAGGGKGAAVGAGAGAGAGTAAEAMTHGERVKIAPESLLTFILDAPVTI
jgi:hypothetical protein